MSSSRVLVTGLSALTACGETADLSWQAILNGQTGIAPIQDWDLNGWSCQLGGELKQFQPAKALPDRKLVKAISRQDAMGINAAMQAIESCGLLNYREHLKTSSESQGDDLAQAFSEDTGIFVGSPGNKYFQQYDFLPLLAKTDSMQTFAQHLNEEVHPMWLLRILPNNVLAYTGICYGFKGPNHNVTNHAVGGAQALIEAYNAIKTGQIQRAVVVAYDMGIEPQALFYYKGLGVISKQHLAPFDEAHDGTILADGAAAIVLESEESAHARGATCYAELLGGLSRSEAQGLFSIEEDGEALADLIDQTLINCQVDKNDISFITAHGNGNEKSDVSEAKALHQVFDKQSPAVTGFKWATGHTLCASGILDTVFSIYALREGCVPGISNFNQLASSCAPLSVSAVHRPLTGHHAMILNRGFASMNACLLLKTYE